MKNYFLLWLVFARLISAVFGDSEQSATPSGRHWEPLKDRQEQGLSRSATVTDQLRHITSAHLYFYECGLIAETDNPPLLHLRLFLAIPWHFFPGGTRTAQRQG